MKRRVLLPASLLIGTAGLCFAIPFLVRLTLRKKLEAAVSRAAGMPCRVASIEKEQDYYVLHGLALGPQEAPVLTIDWLKLSLYESRDLDSLYVENGNACVELAGLPRTEFRELNIEAEHLVFLIRKKPDNPAHIRVRGNCRDLNPLLVEKGKVRFERGSYEITSTVELSGVVIYLPVEIVLSNVLVRSLDGKFEFEAEDVAATVRITGTPQNPKLDLGELEPYLGKKFVESFKEFKP